MIQNYKDLERAMMTLSNSTRELENVYIENGGEITDETILMEDRNAALTDLLINDGVDLLGRWLKSKEDEKAALKAEKDFLTRRLASIDKTIDFIKSRANAVITIAGKTEAKGQLGYCFRPYLSEHIAVNKDLLNERYLDVTKGLLRGAGLPAYVTITLGATVKELNDLNELPDIFEKQVTPTCRFIKPRASKDSE